jgi:hypothetical protein
MQARMARTASLKTPAKALFFIGWHRYFARLFRDPTDLEAIPHLLPEYIL